MEENVKELTAKEIDKNYSAFQKLVRKTENDIALWLKARGIRGLLTEHDSDVYRSPMYGYYMNYDENPDGEVRENFIKAIMLEDDGRVYVVLDYKFVKYEKDNILAQDYEDSDENPHAFYLSDDDRCMGWFTMIDIIEKLNEYDDEECYIK